MHINIQKKETCRASTTQYAESSVRGNEDAEDMAEITELYVAALCIMRVKQCSWCMHCSNERNPILTGPWKRSKARPCWPWLHGDYSYPRGNVCKACNYAFELGGYAAEYKTMANMGKAMNTSAHIIRIHN